MARTITHQSLDAFFGDQDHLDLSQTKTFTQLIFELLSESSPTPEQTKLFDLILNLSIDHGPDTPSAIETIKAAQQGKTISESVADGILQINDRHGGAIEPAMEFFYQIKQNSLDEQGIKDLVSTYLTDHKIIGGFGHRIYKDLDPRSQLIFQTLKDLNFSLEYLEICRQVQTQIAAQKGVNLPINIDGAIAVVLCTFDWSPQLGKAVFLIARTPGLCGQYLNHK